MDDSYMTADDDARLDREFTYHPPTASQVPRYEEIRAAGKMFARTIMSLAPPSPERSTALRLVSEAVMNTNAAIARHEES